MADFNAEHKEEFEQKNYFKEGIHKVKIAGIAFGTLDDGREYADFSVEDAEGNEDTARVWFTTDKAIKYSFNIIKGIFVHNAPEDKQQSTREAVDKLKNTTELEKACQSLMGKEAFFTVYKDESRPYTKKDGTQGFSYNRNITGYEPKARPATITPVAPANGSAPAPATNEDGGPADLPFGF